MDTKSQKWFDRWKQRREKGKVRFILTNGVFGRGLAAGGGSNLLTYIIGESDKSWYSIIISMIVFMLFGAMFSRASWDAKEAWYRSILEKAHSEPPSPTQ